MLLPYDTSTINLTFEMNCQVQLNQIKIDIFCLIKYVFRSLQRSIVKHLLQIRGNWIHFNRIKKLTRICAVISPIVVQVRLRVSDRW